MLTRQELKNKVPHGFIQKIADKAGVSRKQVSRFLNDENITSERVELATLEVLAELSQKKRQLLEQIN